MFFIVLPRNNFTVISGKDVADVFHGVLVSGQDEKKKNADNADAAFGCGNALRIC